MNVTEIKLVHRQDVQLSEFVKDGALPIYQVFRACRLRGPMTIRLVDNCFVDSCYFEGGDLRFLPPDSEEPPDAIRASSVAFLSCNLYDITIVGSPEQVGSTNLPAPV